MKALAKWKVKWNTLDVNYTVVSIGLSLAFIFVALLIAGQKHFDPLLLFLTLCGLFASSLWREKGILVTTLFFILYLIGFFYFKDLVVWKILFTCSLALSIVIFFLSCQELRALYYAKHAKQQQIEIDLKQMVDHLEEEKNADLCLFNEMREKHQSEINRLQEEIQALHQLVAISRAEESKTIEQNDILSQASLKQYREFEKLKLDFAELGEKKDSFETMHLEQKKEYHKQLKELNTMRVDLFQARLLMQALRSQYKPDSSIGQGSMSSSQSQAGGQRLIVDTLEKDKETVEGVYRQVLSDYESLGKMILNQQEKLKHLKEQEKGEKLSQLEHQKGLLAEKKRQLQHIKFELVSLEKQVFIAKKKLQAQGASVS